jgi:hypothetical protein
MTKVLLNEMVGEGDTDRRKYCHTDQGQAAFVEIATEQNRKEASK